MRTKKADIAIQKAEEWLRSQLKNDELGFISTEETISYFLSRNTHVYDSETLICRWVKYISRDIFYNRDIDSETKKRTGITERGHIDQNLTIELLSTVKDCYGYFLFDFIDLPLGDGIELNSIIANVCDWLKIDKLEEWIDAKVHELIEEPSEAYIYQLFEWCRTKRIFNRKYDTMFQKFCLKRVNAIFFNPGRLGSADITSSLAQAIFSIKRLRLEDKYDTFNERVNYLLALQRDNGAWNLFMPDYKYESGENIKRLKEDSLFATCCAIHAIALARPNGWKRSLTQAKNWLLEQQNTDGYWSPYGYPDVSATILALDALNLSEQVEITIYSHLPEENAKEDALKFSLNIEDLKAEKKDNIRVIIAQPEFEKSQFVIDEKKHLFGISFNSKNNRFVDAILKQATKDKADIMVFPEFSVSQKQYARICKWTVNTNTIVVAGSSYLERDGKHYNTAAIFYNGKQYKTEKTRLSPLETTPIKNKGPSESNNPTYFINTPVGKLGVIICADLFYEELRLEIKKLNLDVLCVIACEKNPEDQHQIINQYVKSHPGGLYVLYCNMLCPSVSCGRSALFVRNYNCERSKFAGAKLVSCDTNDTKQLEMSCFEGCLIAECRMDQKTATNGNRDPNRGLVTSIGSPRKFENNVLIEADQDCM